MIYQVIERVGGVNLSKRAALGSPVFPPKRESFCCLTVSQTSPNTGRTCKDICTFSSQMTTEPNSNSWIHFLPQDADNQTHTHVHSLKQNTAVPAQFLIRNTFSMCDFQAYNVHVRVCMSGFQHVDEGLDMCNNHIVWTLLQLQKVCSRILVTRYSKGLLRISTYPSPAKTKAPSHLQWDCNCRHKCAIVATTISCQGDKSAKFLCNKEWVSSLCQVFLSPTNWSP